MSSQPGTRDALRRARDRLAKAQEAFRLEETGQLQYRAVQDEGRMRIVLDDQRRARVHITDQHWHERIELEPDPPDTVHRFVAAGQAAVRALEAAWRDRDRRITVAEDLLALARARTEGVDLAG